jgi:hypothetical protein
MFSSMHAGGLAVTQLPAQWLWVSALPILLVLIVGGYVGKFEAAGVKVELDPRLRAVQYAPPKGSPADAILHKSGVEAHPEAAGVPAGGASPRTWQYERVLEYARTDRLFLVHAYEPSKVPGQRFDVTIFLMRHVPGAGDNEVTGLHDVDKAEFYFGPSWNDKVFVIPNEGQVMGMRTSAWGTFLALCRVTFKDPAKRPVVLFRYIDFTMAPSHT